MGDCWALGGDHAERVVRTAASDHGAGATKAANLYEVANCVCNTGGIKHDVRVEQAEGDVSVHGGSSVSLPVTNLTFPA